MTNREHYGLADLEAVISDDSAFIYYKPKGGGVMAVVAILFKNNYNSIYEVISNWLNEPYAGTCIHAYYDLPL